MPAHLIREPLYSGPEMQPPGLEYSQLLIRSKAWHRELNCVSLRSGVGRLARYIELIMAGNFWRRFYP